MALRDVVAVTAHARPLQSKGSFDLFKMQGDTVQHIQLQKIIQNMQ